MRPPSTHSAFTLIELSIVLVIIGLIVGGILVGRDMIEAAQTRATVAQYEKYKTAVNTFKLKYNVLPGDMSTAEATAIGFAPTTRGGATGVTPDNGLIETGNHSANDCLNGDIIAYETTLFWQDLSSANLIDGSFNSATYGVATPTVGTMGNFLPTAKIPGNYWLILSQPTYKSVYSGQFTVSPGNYFYLMGVASMASSTWINSQNSLTPIQALNIDNKIDDGNPWTGIVKASQADGNSLCLLETIQSNASGQCGGLLANGAPITGYRTDTSPNIPACQLWFQTGF